MAPQTFDEFWSTPLESNDPLNNSFSIDSLETELETQSKLYPGSGQDDDPLNRDHQLAELETGEPFDISSDFSTEGRDSLTGVDTEIPIVADDTPLSFDSGTFVVGDDGQVSVDYVFDGGYYEGELAIFSLTGMEAFDPDSSDFIEEAARRSLSSSILGHIVIADRNEGAKIDGRLPGEPRNWNRGQYAGEKPFEMTPGDRFGVMLVPNGTVEEVYQNPDIGGNRRPLFSMATANPNDAFHVGQVADVTGDGHTFVLEDKRADRDSDRDYNDIIFHVRGAIGTALGIDELIDPGLDWRDSDLGQTILEDGDRPNLPQVNATFEDTGLSDSDGITSTVKISGSISNGNHLSRLWANIEGFAPVDITDWLGTDGQFDIDRDRFVELLDGTPLKDGDYTLVFQTEDYEGNRSDPSEISLTLD